MKRRIVEWYNRNRPKISFIIIFMLIIIVANIVLVYLSNEIRKEQMEEEPTQNVMDYEIQEEFNQITIGSDSSALSGDDLTSSQIEMLDIIEQFAEYCNNGNVEEAYSFLSNECKDEMYKTLNDFKVSYYDQVFAGEKKSISVENWSANIYKVTIQKDILSTGIYTDEDTLQDYMSVITDEDDNYKLNINGYLGRKDINLTEAQDNLEITVLRSDTYKDYQTYTFKIVNNSDNTILLDDKSNINSMYLEDENGVEYSAYTHEISDAELVIPSGQTREIEIKYYNKYISSKQIEKIVFSRIVLKYNIGERYNYGNIQIEI